MKTKKQKTLYDLYRKFTAQAFNYPTVKLVSNGDIITYLESVKL